MEKKSPSKPRSPPSEIRILSALKLLRALEKADLNIIEMGELCAVAEMRVYPFLNALRNLCGVRIESDEGWAGLGPHHRAAYKLLDRGIFKKDIPLPTYTYTEKNYPTMVREVPGVFSDGTVIDPRMKVANTIRLLQLLGAESMTMAELTEAMGLSEKSINHMMWLVERTCAVVITRRGDGDDTSYRIYQKDFGVFNPEMLFLAKKKRA